MSLKGNSIKEVSQRIGRLLKETDYIDKQGKYHKSSLRKLSAQLHVSAGTLSRVIDGYEPKSPQIRRALGLPIIVRVLACAMCGQMHLNPSKVCPTRNRVNRQIRMPIAELPARVLAWKIRNREEM